MENGVLSSPPSQIVKFLTGLRKNNKYPVIPVFFPFLFCPGRCIFCAQTVQTGQSAVTPTTAPLRLEAALHGVSERDEQVEIAFYGGTFTLWPRQMQYSFLRMVRDTLGARVARVRCSTRPDALEADHLARLRQMGLGMVEVGVQSFDDAALDAARRGYDGATAIRGCRAAAAAGLDVGVQLMPGMPGVTPEVFVRDVAIALELGATCLRFYPCMVIEGTPLAEAWREGRYTPWDLPTTVRTLGKALALAWAAGVPVIRMGLAPEATLDAAVLAGPWHPHLGGLAQGQALVETIARLLAGAGGRARTLHLPTPCRGFMGGKNSPVWQGLDALGLPFAAVSWHDAAEACLEID